MNNMNAPCLNFSFIFTRTTTTKTTTATSKYSTEENIKPGSNEYVWPWLWIFGGIFICGSLLTIILSAIDNTYKRKNFKVLLIFKGNCMSLRVKYWACRCKMYVFKPCFPLVFKTLNQIIVGSQNFSTFRINEYPTFLTDLNKNVLVR